MDYIKSKIDEVKIKARMKELANKLNYEYKNLKWLEIAMNSIKLPKTIHDGKNRKQYVNSSLATLGDTIIKFILTEYYYDLGCDRGQITQNKGDIENNSNFELVRYVNNIESYAYNDYYFADEEAPQHQKVAVNNHDVYIEAIVGAVYKDRGMRYTRNFVFNLLGFKNN